jgi:pantetheine-phosphate adenylyltransferase
VGGTVRRAVCPGSFDPVTLGHLDIVGRASRLFDEVVVAVGTNVSKSRLFAPDERIAMVRRACADLDNVAVEGFAGLVTTFCAERDATAIVKGLRAAADFDYELQMAQMNTSLTGIETVFMPASPARGFVSSSLVKEVAGFGGDVSAYVPDFVHDALQARLSR